MQLLLDLIAWIVCAPVAVVSSVFALEVLLGLPRPGTPRLRREPRSTVILIPAHDEELGIGAMLATLLNALPATMKPLVVADNCSDRTAAIAREAGVEAIERHDPSRRGKGYALAFGRDHLRADPPDCVVIFDADCEAGAEDLHALVAAANAWDAPVQASYLLRADRQAPPMVQVSNFAMAVKNDVRQLGISRIGAPAVLTGTGMALPWRLFEPAELASGSLAEDLELGIALAREGNPPRFLPSARVWSLASNPAATLVQRSRWEGGYVAMATRHALPLLGAALRSGSGRLAWLALHIATPPLALLMFLNLFALILLAMVTLSGAHAAALLLLCVVDVAVFAALIGAWLRVGRLYLSPGAALRLPLYALWKIPIYLKLARGGEKRWIRTERTP